MYKAFAGASALLICLFAADGMAVKNEGYRYSCPLPSQIAMNTKTRGYEAEVGGQAKDEAPSEIEFKGPPMKGGMMVAHITNIAVRVHNRVDKSQDGKVFESDIYCLYSLPKRSGVFKMMATVKGMKCKRHVVVFNPDVEAVKCEAKPRKKK